MNHDVYIYILINTARHVSGWCGDLSERVKQKRSTSVRYRGIQTPAFLACSAVSVLLQCCHFSLAVLASIGCHHLNRGITADRKHSV